jgi:hypothetical protein
MKRNSTIAYLRVSTAAQDVEKNKSDILHLANEKELGKVGWVEEQAWGIFGIRPKIYNSVTTSANYLYQGCCAYACRNVQ